MTDANANIQINGSVAPIIEAELAKLNASIQRTISNLQLFNSSSKNLSTGTDTIGVALNGISKGLKDTSHHLQQLTTQQASLSAGFRGNAKAIEETVKQIDRLRKANSQASQTGIKFDLAPLKRYQSQLEAVNRASASITNANKAATFKQIGAGYEGLSQKLNYASQRLTFGLSLPIAGFLRTGFNSLKSMSTQTVRLNKLLDDSYSSTVRAGQAQSDLDTALKDIGLRLDALSGKWGVSRELLQAVAGDFAEIGISSASALAILTQTTVEFEKLGNVDISQAGETVRALYQNMARIRRDKGLGVTSSKDIEEMMSEVRGAVALFNFAENKTSLSLKNMSEAFPEVSAAATSFGLDMATTAALLVPMIGAAIKTGTAANSLKISIQGLVNVTKKAGMDLAEVNKYFGTDIAMGGEIGAAGLQKLAIAYGKLKDVAGDAQALSTFGDFFGKRQAPRFEISIQQAQQFLEKLEDASSAESELLGGLEKRINASLKLNGLKGIELKNIVDINNLTKLAQERDDSGNFTARANLIQKAQKEQVKNLTDQEKLGKAINGISTEYGKIQVAGAFGSSLTGQTLIDELKKAEQSLEVKYGKARENIKSISRELTTVLADILNVLNPIIQRVAKAFQNMSSPVKKVIGLVLVLAAVLGPMVRTFAAGFQLVGAISRGFGKITEIKSMGKSTVELNKELLKTNDLAFRLGGNFEAFGKNGAVFTDKKNIKPLQKLSALQEKEDSGEALTKLEQSEKKKALIKLAGKKAVRDGTALSKKRDFSKVDLVTEQALKKVYRPQDQIRDVGDAAMESANAAVYKGRKGRKRATVTAESLGLVVRDTASSRGASTPPVSTATPTAPTRTSVSVPTPTRTSGAAPVSNIYEPILKQILTVLKGIEVCACAGKTAMTGPSTPPTSGPTASPRGPTPVAPAGGSTATPAPSSSPDLSKMSDEELTAGITRLEAETKVVDEEIKASKDLIAKLKEDAARAKRGAAQVRIDKAKLGTRGTKPIALGGSEVPEIPTVGEVVKPKRTRKPREQKIEDAAVNKKADDIKEAAAELVIEEPKPKPTRSKDVKPKGTKEKVFKPVADFADKLSADQMALLNAAGVAEVTSAQKVGVAFDLTKQHLINLFESLGKEVPEGLKKITQIVDKATGQAIRITPASLAKIKASIESGKLQSLVDTGTGDTGNRSLNEAIRGATGKAKQRTRTAVTYENVRSGRDQDEQGFVGTSLRTGNVQLQQSKKYYQALFEELKTLSIAAGATENDIKNLTIKFRTFLRVLRDIERVNEGSLVPDIKSPMHLIDAMEDTVRGKKSRIAKFGRANSVRGAGLEINEQDLQSSLGAVPSDLRVDPKVQSALEAKLPKNRNFYKVKRQEYSLNNPLRAAAVSSGETTKGKKFEYGPLAGMVKKPIDKLTDAQYEKFSAARRAMIEKARRSLEVKQSRPEDEVDDFKNIKPPTMVAEPKGTGKRSEKIITEGDIEGILAKRRAELQAEHSDPALVDRLMKRFEATTRARVSRTNKPIEKAAEAKAKKTTEQVVDDGPALSADEYIAQKKARIDAEEAERKRLEKNAKAKAKRDAAKAEKAAGGGGAVGGTSFGGVNDPFDPVMGTGMRPRGPRIPQIGPKLMQMSKGSVLGSVNSVYGEIQHALKIPDEIMSALVAEIKGRAAKMHAVGIENVNNIKGDLGSVIEGIKSTLGTADMTVENLYAAIIAKRNDMYKLTTAKAGGKTTAAPAAKEGMIGNLNRVDLVASGDDAYAQMQKLAAHMKEFGIDLSQLNQLSAKQLQYLADAISGGTERTKPVVPRKLTDTKAKAIAIIEDAIGDKLTRDAVTVAAAPTKPTRVAKPKDAPAGSIPTPPPETKPSSITTPVTLGTKPSATPVKLGIKPTPAAIFSEEDKARVRANVAASKAVREAIMAARIRANVAASAAVRAARASAPLEQAQRAMAARVRANVAASKAVRAARASAPMEQAQRTAEKVRNDLAKIREKNEMAARIRANVEASAAVRQARLNAPREQAQRVVVKKTEKLKGMLDPYRNLGLRDMMASRDIEQQRVPGRILDILNPLRVASRKITPEKIEYVSRALSGKAPTPEMRDTDIITGKPQEKKRGFKASATRGLMAVGRGLQKTSLAPVFASGYEAYMPTALQMKIGRGGRLQSTVAGQRPTTGMAGGAARQGVFQRLGIQTPQPVSTGQREGLVKVLHGANLPSAFETGSVKLLASIKKLSPVFDTAIQVAAKMAIEGGKLPYTIAKVYGKAVIDAHKITGQAISTAYSMFKASSFAQNNPIGQTLLTLSKTIEKAVGSVSSAIKATVNAVKNPAQVLDSAKNAITQAGRNFLAASKKAAGNFIKGKEILDDAGNATGERKGGLAQPFRSTKQAFSKEGRARMGEKFTGLKASAGAGIRNAASQGISTLTMGLGPLGSLANGPLMKIVNVMLKFKKVAISVSLPLLLIVGTIMLLKATFGAFSDKAGDTMKNFRNVINTVKNIVNALKRAFFDFFASLFGPAKDSEGAMGNVGKQVENVSNIVARFANSFMRVFKSTILPAIYSVLSGLSLLIRGVVTIFGGIFNIIKGVVQKFTGQGDKAGKSFDKGLSMLKDGFFKVFKGIIKFLAIPLKIIVSLFMKIVEYIVQLFEFLVIGVVNLIRYMVKGIINVSFTIVKAYVWIMDKVIELFVMLEKVAINIAIATVKGVVNAFFSIIKAVIFVVQKIIDLFALIPAGVGKGFSILTGLIAGLLRKIADKLPNLFGIKDKVNGVADAIDGAGKSAEEMGNKTKDALNGVLDPVTKGVQAGQNKILGFIDDIGGAALSNISKLNNLGDFVLKALGAAQNALLDGVDNASDAFNRLVGSSSDGINKLRQGIINWIDSVAEGDDIVKGIGDKMKDEVKDTLDQIADPQAAIAAGKTIALGIQKGLKELKMNFYDKVTESLGDSLSKLKDGMKDALGKQKDQQLKFFDDQIAAIDALAAAEEELTAKKKYEEDKRDRIAERALQRDAYRKNRALAIYEGRVEDARTMSLQEEKDNKDFNKDIASMDTDRRNVLQGQNRDAAKSAIERQKQEASEQFDLQIKNFEDLIENIGKYGTLSKEDLQAQFTALNAQAVTASGDMKAAFEGYYTALPGIIQANTDPTVGMFTAGIDTLIAAAAGKYGAAQGVSDPTTMLGLTNQMLANTGTAYTEGFATTIVPAYNDGQNAIAAIATDFADETKPNSLAGIYRLAITNATAAITAEFVKMKTEASAAFADVVKGINDELKNLAIAQAITDAKEQIAADGGSTTGGGTTPGTPSQGSGATAPAGPAKFGPMGLTQTAFEALANKVGNDRLFKLNDSNDYIKTAKAALAFYGYSGFDVNSTKMGTGTVAALKKFQKDYPVGGNNDGNLGPSTAKALGLFGSAGLQKKYNGGMIKKMMTGGAVPGFSNQGVPAILHGGEYVINAKAVQNLGMSVLAQLNGLKNGVPSINVPKPQMPNTSGMSMNVTSHSSSELTHNYNFYVDNFIGEDRWFESMMKEYNVKVIPNNQKAAGLESRVVRTYNGINKGM